MKHILIADDNPGMAALVARALPDYTVTTAHNGLEALVLAKTLPACDLLIADYLMPALNGTQVAARLRTERPAVKTLLMTAHTGMIEAGDDATDDQIAKPFNPAALRKRVQSLIGTA